MTPNQAFRDHFNFHRTTRFSESISAKKRKDWLSKDKRYRITWRNTVFGIQIAAGYYALKYTKSTYPNIVGYWDHADKRGLYKTLNSAIKACMKAEKLDITHVSKRTSTKRKKMFDNRELELTTTTTPVEDTPPKRRGRPKGSKNSKPRSDKGAKRGPRQTSNS